MNVSQSQLNDHGKDSRQNGLPTIRDNHRDLPEEAVSVLENNMDVAEELLRMQMNL